MRLAAALALGLALGGALGGASPARAQDSVAAPAAQDPAAQREQEKAALLRFCQTTDMSAAATVAGTKERTDCWKRMQLEGMGDAVVDAKYLAAVADYDKAMARDSLRRASDSSTASMDQRMRAVQQAIQTRDLDGAESAVDDILAIQPANQRALAAKDRIVSLKRARQLKIALFGIGAAVLAAAAGLAVLAKKFSKKDGEKRERKKAEAAARKAVVKIVDGIGRGKLYTVEGALFRIGAAGSDKAEERNDLVLSDSAASISRFHCSIIRKDGRFYLIDSSLNGTVLNDEPLERGEHHALKDGDEFTVANVARMKFLMM